MNKKGYVVYVYTGDMSGWVRQDMATGEMVCDEKRLLAQIFHNREDAEAEAALWNNDGWLSLVIAV